MPTRSFGSVTIFSPRHDRAEILDTLRDSVSDLRDQLPLRQLILFGSQASGRSTVRSDIDLLVIYDDPPRDDAFRIVKKTIPLQGLEPHLFTVNEANERSDLIERMTRTSEVVFRADQEE